MGYFRILLIPVFCILYYHSENAGCFYGAVIVLCLSFLSDFFEWRGFEVCAAIKIPLTNHMKSVTLK